jgi:hypothetical protein
LSSKQPRRLNLNHCQRSFFYALLNPSHMVCAHIHTLSRFHPVSFTLFMRQDLLHLAESFLTSESVQSSDKESKIHFLRNKGLKDEEIEEAFKRVEGDTAIHQVTPLHLKIKAM